MKIGILTLPISENYGGILQAIALYRLLHNQGHDVTLVYKAHDASGIKLWKKIIKNVLIAIPFQDFKNLKANKKASQERDKRAVLHRPFIEKEIFKISQNLYTKDDLEAFTKDERFDAVVVGSDQVWRKKYMGTGYLNYFLDFVDGTKTKKIAYAASFGKDYWEGQNDHKDIAKLLQDFTAISTRELSGVDICKDTFAYDKAKHVLDPTMLIGKEFYLDMISKYDTSNIPKGGLLTYVLDEADEKKQIIEYVQKEQKTNNTNHLKGFNPTNTTYTVPQWLASFANADIVVTDSFHGMVFSMIFQKDFVVIGNKSRGLDRFVSLLGLLGLEDRLVFDVKDLQSKEIGSVDYEKVNKILSENIEKSKEFLLTALDK